MALFPLKFGLGRLRRNRRRGSDDNPSLFLPAAILTVLAVGCGAGLGLHLAAITIASDQAPKLSPKDAASLLNYDNPRVKKLPPIVTNLAEPAEMWARLEATVVFADVLPDTNMYTVQISEDVVAFLRTVKLSQIEGPSNFQHLREDLKDRVAIRSGGEVSELIIESLVVQ
jgi:flagellar FliL protein